MHARREMDEVVPRRQRRAGLGVADERGDRDDPDETGRARASDHRVPIGVEVLQRQVGVAVAEQVEAPAYFTFQPGATGSSVVRMVGCPEASEAARSIPCDTTPRSFAGLRLATTTIVLPISDSGG